MTIRTKLTLWYGVVLFASLTLCGALLYKEWVIDPRKDAGVRATESFQQTIDDLVENLLWSALPAAVLGLGGGWLLTRKALAPISELTAAARKINESTLSVRLPRSRNEDELDQLTAVFNEMIYRLESSFQRIREFTLRASHELKTPLTIMRGGMESTVRQNDLSAEIREKFQEQIDEIDRLAKIVDGLTLLTKADASIVKLGSEPVLLSQLVEEIYQDGQILAEPYGITLALVANDPVFIRGDRNRLRQLLLNLVDNAVKYNHEGGAVSLELCGLENMVMLTISNTSQPLSSEQIERVFDPFFRGDQSHARDMEGCGLGLAIARWIVTAHHGTISLSSEEGKTTVVRAQFPMMQNGT